MLIVFENPRLWPLHFPGAEIVSAKDYLTKQEYAQRKGAKVFNLCRSYRYQSLGYYVSLLAAARNHKAFPGISTIQEMKSPTIIQIIAEDLQELIQRTLAPLQSDRFELSIYFGKNVARKYDRLSLQIFNLFQAPLLRAYFRRRREKWRLQNVRLISLNDIPDTHRNDLIAFATAYLAKRYRSVRRKPIRPYDMAILHSEQDTEPPSDDKAIQNFVKAAEKSGFNTEIIDKSDSHHLAEFDALFLRDTTSVNHHTFRFAQRAEAEGLVVIDDPQSILKCTNKVYLAELLEQHNIPAPATCILNRDNLDSAVVQLGFPMILKQPDSSFSQGVIKVEDRKEYLEQATALLQKSDFIIAQEFTFTQFDWRIGVIDRQPLYACKYYMADSHWQIMNWANEGRSRYGKTEAVALSDVPPVVLKHALKAANLIGDSLYGVDLKTVGRKCYIIEINDNPSLESGEEDALLKDELYLRIMQVFRDRVSRRKNGQPA